MPAGVNMVRSMWLFKHKFHADGTLSCYKACLVANSSSQQLGVDFDETISPVVKRATIHTVLSLVVSHKWPIHQLDVKNAFLNGYATHAGFYHSSCDSSLFICRQGSQVAYLLIYVDDIILTSSSPALLQKYALQLLERAYMVHCNPSRTSIDTESKLGPDGVPGASLCCSQAYLAICLRDCGLLSPVICFRYYFSAKRQHTLSRSSAKAEYRGVANVVAETTWLRNLLRELHSPLSTTTLVYRDNVSAVYMSANPVQHQQTKHIKIDIHFVRDMVTAGQVRVLHVPSRY
ncbi:ribonuclease H-like domain-containing protein [Tanacetum coccineum]